MLLKYKLSVLLLTLVLLITIEATLTPKSKGANKKTTKQKEFKVINGPQEESVFDRNLVEEEPASRDIISDNAAYYRRTDKKLFNGTILGYVTPVCLLIISLLVKKIKKKMVFIFFEVE